MTREYTRTKKRNKRSKASKNAHIRKRVMNNILEATNFVSENAHVEYFNLIPEEHFPPLEIERDVVTAPIPNPTGNRIVDLSFFLTEMEKIRDHHQFCTMGKMKYLKEKRQGITSVLTFYCSVCYKAIKISTHPSNSNVNESLVWGATSIGIGYAQAEEFFSLMNIPTITPKLYRKIEQVLGKKWENELQKQMSQAAEEERALAIERGDVEQGIPYITVIVDGGWAKRSYGHGFSSLSGVGCIIGEKTKKLLFMGVRNKFCFVCSRAENNEVVVPSHKCFKNFDGFSSSMEQHIIVEGFNASEKYFNLRYKYVIGDGDSSVYTNILECVTYGRYVQKLECANHITRACTSNLHKLATDTKFEISVRRLLKDRLPRISAAIRMSIKNRQNTDQLCNDLRNIPNHVFGSHSECRDEYCRRKNTEETNLLPLLKSSTIWEQVNKILDNVIRKAHRLTKNVTTNLAERFMSLVAKFTGGKRVNFILRGSYQRRCYGAGLSFNSGYSWHKFSNSEDLHYLNKFCCKRKRANERQQKVKKRKLDTNKNKRECLDYGPNADQPDISDSEMETSKKRILSELMAVDFDAIERGTVGQHNNAKWLEERRNRLTASSFGRICLRRPTTSCHSLVKQLLYSRNNLTTPAISYGRLYEKQAIAKYEKTYNVTVKPCGLFISKQYPYLGASPDGLINNDGLVEVKCLFSVRNMLIQDAVINNSHKSLCLKLVNNELVLKENHIYNYQIQGQLNVLDREYCDLVLYTDKDLQIIRIVKNKNLWLNNMLPKLEEFFMHCLLPEIVDPRIPRGLKARDSNLIVQAQRNREERKNQV